MLHAQDKASEKFLSRQFAADRAGGGMCCVCVCVCVCIHVYVKYAHGSMCVKYTA